MYNFVWYTSNFFDIYSKINRLLFKRFFVDWVVFNLAEDTAIKGSFNSNSYLFLGRDDEKWTEDDERESEAIFDKDVMKFILLGVSKDQVDVVVWDVDEDQSGEKEKGERRYSERSAAGGERKTDDADDEGDEGTEDGGDVDWEVEGDLVQQILFLADYWTKADICTSSLCFIIEIDTAACYHIYKKIYIMYNI